jgi:SAM-dependent methyltransferase
VSGADLFNRYAKGYDEVLAKAIGPSGETREYFAEGRVAWLKRCLDALGIKPGALLDYGCGDGSTTPLLLTAFGANSATGVDVSTGSIEIARSRPPNSHLSYVSVSDFDVSAKIDLAYCNGVFHHIEPRDWVSALAFIRRALKTHGLLSFWENNPWNPATRYVMYRCEFDRDTTTLTPRVARRLIRENGFEVLRTDYRFIFPRALRAFRNVEDIVHRLPFGTQYQVLARKLDSSLP